jgi:glutamate-1-semialdehyde 2,1-aminomutase
MAAGIATMSELAKPGAYEALRVASRALADGIADSARRADVAIQTSAVGGMWGFFFNDGPVIDYTSAKRSDTARFARFFHACLNGDVYLAPSQFEACFVSLAHDADAIARTLEAFRTALEQS